MNCFVKDLQELLRLEPDNKIAKAELDRISNVSCCLSQSMSTQVYGVVTARVITVASVLCSPLQLAGQSVEEARQSSSKGVQGLVLPVNRPTYMRSKVVNEIVVLPSLENALHRNH